MRRQRVVWKFLREDHRRGILTLELAARRDADEDQAIVRRVHHSVRAAVVVTRAAHEDLCFALDLLAVVKHSPTKLAIRGNVRLRRVDVTHEEEVAEEQKSDEDHGKPE